jgi:hypothetical protein
LKLNEIRRGLALRYSTDTSPRCQREANCFNHFPWDLEADMRSDAKTFRGQFLGAAVRCACCELMPLQSAGPRNIFWLTTPQVLVNTVDFCSRVTKVPPHRRQTNCPITRSSQVKHPRAKMALTTPCWRCSPGRTSIGKVRATVALLPSRLELGDLTWDLRSQSQDAVWSP